MPRGDTFPYQRKPGGGAAESSKLPDSRVKFFDQQVRAVNQLTGEPIANMPYKLTTASGDVSYDMTDQDGKTSRVATVGQEVVRVEWGVVAPKVNA